MTLNSSALEICYIDEEGLISSSLPESTVKNPIFWKMNQRSNNILLSIVTVAQGFNKLECQSVNRYFARCVARGSENVIPWKKASMTADDSPTIMVRWLVGRIEIARFLEISSNNCLIT